MPSREQTIADAIRIFENAVYSSTVDLASAWLGIYQTLLWYEPINFLGFSELPHVIDADKLRPSSAAKRKGWRRPNAWQIRAQALHEHLANRLNCSTEEVSGKMDLLMNHVDYVGMQRQNSLGIAFAGLVSHVLQKFGPDKLQYEPEVVASIIFPGITVPGRSSTPKMDLLVRQGGLPRAIVSAKWSVRHDRLNDITNECPVYKAAYQRIYRQTRKELLYFVVTNEYDPSRLTKMLDDDCVNGIVHVYKSGVVNVCKMNKRLTQLIDLADFVQHLQSW